MCSYVFFFYQLDKHRMEFTMILIYICPDKGDFEYFFIYLKTIFIYFLQVSLCVLFTISISVFHLPNFFSVFFLFFFIYFYQLEANYFTILQWVLSYIDMNQPWIYMYSPSQSPLPPPSLPDPCGSSQCYLQPHGLQHTRLTCPSPSPGVCSKSCPLSL